MNFENFLDEQLNEDAKSAMQAAHEAHQKEMEHIDANHNGAERTAKRKAAISSFEKRKDQIRRNLQTH